MRLFEAAGFPPGVINVVHGDGASVANACIMHPSLAGVHFTGSTRGVPVDLEGRRRAHRELQDVPAARRRDRRQGLRLRASVAPSRTRSPSRSCAAPTSSRARSARPRRARTCRSRSGRRCARGCSTRSARFAMGDVRDFRNFMGAVINERAWTRLTEWIDRVTHDAACKISTEDKLTSQRARLVRRADARRGERSEARHHADRALRSRARASSSTTTRASTRRCASSTRRARTA